jgi:DHA3 family tetracycline resistance protein-like MFS transporter
VLVARHRADAYRIYLFLMGAGAFIATLFGTINLIFQVQVAHLSPLQLVLIGTALEATAFVFEIPTGIVADVYSRRLSILIGAFVTGAGILLMAIPSFAALLLSSFVWGVGCTFESGAQEAWIADEVGAARAGQVYLRAAQVAQLGALVGIVASVVLASIHLQLPIVMAGGLKLLLGVFLVLFMPETGFHPAGSERRESWRAMGETLRAGVGLVRLRPILLTILGIAAFGGMASEGFDRLKADHFLTDFGLPRIATLSPIYWFGLMGIGGMALSIAANELVRRRVDTASHTAVTRVLFVIEALLVVSLVTFGLARSFALALAAYWAVGLMRQVSEPLRIAWINQSVAPRVRATVFSIAAQADAFGQIAGGPVVGWIGTVRSLRAALVTTGLVLSPALLLFARALGQGKTESPLEVEVAEASQSAP